MPFLPFATVNCYRESGLLARFPIQRTGAVDHGWDLKQESEPAPNGGMLLVRERAMVHRYGWVWGSGT